MKFGEFTARYISTVPSIADCHAKRIGWGRTISGGLSMYLSIPVWIIVHLTSATTLYQLFLRPMLGLKKISLSDYVIIDRHKIEGLVWVDRINCNFCGYANGLTTMINAELDELGRCKIHVSKIMLIPLYVVIAIFSLISLIADIVAINLVYSTIVAPILGMKTTKALLVFKILMKNGYGNNFNQINRLILVYNKSVFFRFSKLLQQIETSWCPLKHLDTRDGVKYPKHHEDFYNFNELDIVKEQLVSKGTISPKNNQ